MHNGKLLTYTLESTNFRFALESDLICVLLRFDACVEYMFEYYIRIHI